MNNRTFLAFLITAFLAVHTALALPNFSNHQDGASQLIFHALPPYASVDFDCRSSSTACLNYGECVASTGYCICPTGFGGVDCGQPVCGSPMHGQNRTQKAPQSPHCECDQGWSGLNCNVCQEKSDACGASHSCIASPFPQSSKMRASQYSNCRTTSRHIRALLGTDLDWTMECNAEERACLFGVWYESVETFSCRMRDCDLDLKENPGNSTAQCANVECSCIPNSPFCDPYNMDLSEVLASVKGPSSLECGSSRLANGQHACVLSEPVLKDLVQESVGLQCQFGQCL